MPSRIASGDRIVCCTYGPGMCARCQVKYFGKAASDKKDRPFPTNFTGAISVRR